MASLKIRLIPGFVYGLRHASLHLIASNEFAYGGCIPLAGEKTDRSHCDGALRRLVDDYLELWALAGFPSSNGCKWVSASSVFVSSAFVGLADAAVLIENLIRIDEHSDPGFGRRALEELVQRAKSALPLGYTTIHFIQAADQMDMTWLYVSRARNLIQYGEGSRLHVMDSSLTDQQSLLGGRLAQDKALSTSYLRSLGYPVQTNRCISNLDEARSFASDHYPVVVKPVNADRGEDVELDIRDEATLASIVARLLEKYPSLLVEKYLDGSDYRLIVWKGCLVWAYRRNRPCVVGDGTSSIADLLSAENQRLSSSSSARYPRSILQDRSFDQCLADQGFDLSSVLLRGEVCVVGVYGLLFRGGSPEACLDRVHPDNARLAVDCCEQIGVDLAGIDLVMPDISVSWKDSAAHICEVNVKPMLGFHSQEHLPQLILESLVGSGHMPAVLVVVSDQSPLAEAIGQWLSLQQDTLGFGLWSSVQRDLHAMRPVMDRRFSSCVALMRDQDLALEGAPLPVFGQVLIEQPLMESFNQDQRDLLLGYYGRTSVSAPELMTFADYSEFVRLALPLLSQLSIAA